MPWLQCIPNRFKNINLIFPTQQQDVYNLIQASIPDKNIRKIIIFGNSVTKACNPWSDIDVYFEKKKEGKFPAVGRQSANYPHINLEVRVQGRRDPFRAYPAADGCLPEIWTPYCREDREQCRRGQG